MKRFYWTLAAIAGLALLCLVIIGSAMALAADGQCAVISQEEFFAQVRRKILKLHTIEPKKMQNYLNNKNAARLAVGQFALEADIMVVAELPGGWLGTIMFKDGCVVPGTDEVLPIAQMREFFKTMNAEDILDGIGRAP